MAKVKRFKSRNPLTPKKSGRPKCLFPGCVNSKHLMHTNPRTGTTTWRKYCDKHRHYETAIKRGITVAALRRSLHRYKKYRKNYCENIDGKWTGGNPCPMNNRKINDIEDSAGILDVDHINGDKTNHKESNLQTLCKCCHAIKTHLHDRNGGKIKTQYDPVLLDTLFGPIED